MSYMHLYVIVFYLFNWSANFLCLSLHFWFRDVLILSLLAAIATDPNFFSMHSE